MNETSENPPLRARDASGEPIPLGQYNGFEVYPMPMFAVLACRDVARAAAWYESALGFATLFQTPMSSGLAMIHVRRHKYQDLLLVPAKEGLETAGTGLHLVFSAHGEIDGLFHRALAAATSGSSRVEEPAQTPWDTYELKVTDPDGHRVVFTERKATPEGAARWQKMFEEARKK